MVNDGSTKRGFTLIELLVVISIIALLIGILLPALSSARKSATNMKCLSNIRQVALAMTMYETDNSRYPTHYRELNPANAWWPNQVADTSGLDVRELFEHYMEMQYYWCPFLPFWARGTDAIPLGTRRIYLDYNITPGYMQNYKDGQYGETWTNAAEFWEYDGHRMEVIVGDQFTLTPDPQYRVNHADHVAGFELLSREDPSQSSWLGSVYTGSNFPADPRLQASANFAMRDGSAASYSGSDDQMIDIKANNGLTAHMMPAVD